MKKNIIIFSIAFIIMFFMSVGYSYFDSYLNLGAEGVINAPSLVKLNELIIDNEETTGTGTLKNTTNTTNYFYFGRNKYFFQGENVNNYVLFNNELWRVISIEEDGSVKIIRNALLSKRAWDSAGHRNSSNQTYDRTTYCPKNLWIFSKGCNPYTSGMYEPLGNNDSFSGNNTGLNATQYSTLSVEENSDLYNYLHNTYYNTLSILAKSQIIQTNYDFSFLESDATTWVRLSENHNRLLVRDNVAFPSVIEVIMASSNSNCSGNFNDNNCFSSNWIADSAESNSWWVSNPKEQNRTQAYYVRTSWGSTSITASDVNNSYYIRPVVTLNSEISAVGSGTCVTNDCNTAEDDPYILGEFVSR